MTDKKLLKGVRIISVEQFGAAPYGSMFLADLGADVIKIENRDHGGDPSRHIGPFLIGEHDSEYFQTWNSNKKSVSLDLKSPGGRAAFERLVIDADAVMNNLRGDKAERLQLDHASLSKIKPSIVCLHLSAYGRHNERASWPGYDYLMQAESGLMALTGDSDRPPTRMGAPSIIDHTTGLTAMIGLLSGVIHARATGEGCDVDTCLYDVALHQLGYTATWYLNEGFVPERQDRSGHFSLAAVQTFPTADGWIFVMCMTQAFWLVLLEAIDRTDLKDDPRFADNEARSKHREDVTAVLDPEFRDKPTTYWLARLGGKLPVAPVLSLKQALDQPFLETAGLIDTVDHPIKGKLRILANPIRVDGKRLAKRAGPAIGADDKLLDDPGT